MEKNEIFVKCDCETEGIEVQHWNDEKSLCFSFWAYGRSNTSSIPWRHRVRMIWKILMGKDLYSDMVILNYEKAKEVADFINKEIQ